VLNTQVQTVSIKISDVAGHAGYIAVHAYHRCEPASNAAKRITTLASHTYFTISRAQEFYEPDLSLSIRALRTMRNRWQHGGFNNGQFQTFQYGCDPVGGGRHPVFAQQAVVGRDLQAF
jgi:hypothetical protein